jgi:hypothetical protein
MPTVPQVITPYLAQSHPLAEVMAEGLLLAETVALVVVPVQNLALTHLVQVELEILRL